MNLTPSEILRVKTKGTLNIIKDSPLHIAVISAMEYYAKQEVKKATTNNKQIGAKQNTQH